MDKKVSSELIASFLRAEVNQGEGYSYVRFEVFAAVSMKNVVFVYNFVHQERWFSSAGWRTVITWSKTICLAGMYTKLHGTSGM
jgi:hypothetical protein